MIADNLVKQLKSENELLQIQLQDLNYMIEAREEELDMLRKTAAHAVQLQSRLDHNLFEIEQMQDMIGEKQREAQGALKREASLGNRNVSEYPDGTGVLRNQGSV
jgi:predicted RNase H-like nuclease (RuvC/YqgF family)